MESLGIRLGVTDDERPLPKQLEARGYWQYSESDGPGEFMIDPNGDEVLTSWIGPPEVFNRFRELSDLPLAFWFLKNTAIDFLGETNWVAIEEMRHQRRRGFWDRAPGGRFY